MALYHFELQMAGIILLSAMAAGAISLWLRRRRERREEDAASGIRPGGPPGAPE
ncbi:MAG: hypothetical protein MPJ06_07290 [Nitrosopumilus sp.]|nr:hypothetical protein [Nitrosopumilus sp.]MDA7943790.1 hypothetical protein [Nitrosopumilus sp.]MDA7960402.1 hypothetical protein [Nitrosopumilus sp.]MDA7998929.1 hypothetical protein [Nitrosopumilus sp.]